MLSMLTIILLSFIIILLFRRQRIHIVQANMGNFILFVDGPLHHEEKNPQNKHIPGMPHEAPLPPPHLGPGHLPAGIKPPPPHKTEIHPAALKQPPSDSKTEIQSKRNFEQRTRKSRLFILINLILIEAAIAILLSMLGLGSYVVIAVFIITMCLIMTRFGELNEAYPAAIGAAVVLTTGIVNKSNLIEVVQKIGGSSVTIIATLVMAIVLESFGFFHWAAAKLVKFSKGSGYRLYFLIQLLCFLMTLLFNNDGSIMITTPILILLLKSIQLKPHDKIPYLISGALIATSSSAPIGVSNIVNLISLNIVHMTLYSYTAMMFIPSTLGIVFMSVLMFLFLKDRFPRQLQTPMNDIEDTFFTANELKSITIPFDKINNRNGFMFIMLAYVLVIRCLIFVASYFGISIEIVATAGSFLLLLIRRYYLQKGFTDVIRKGPWHILIFALSMYIIIFGLHNIGLTNYLGTICRSFISKSLFNTSFIMGALTTVMSNLFNNHPALMISTIVIKNMALDPVTLKLAYLSNIIGSDIGSLLLPIGTLASLLWMFILKKNGIRIAWKEYVRVTMAVIPATVLFTLFILYFWVQFLFK